MATGRETAVRILAACRKDGAWSDGKVKSEIERAKLSAEETGLCTRIVYGVMQNLLLIDFYISKFCSVRLKKLEPRILDILRSGVYQIVFLDRVPDSAAVNESVKLAKKMSNPRAAGLVNGTLRAVSRCEKLPEPAGEDETQRLSVLYSHPQRLVEHFIKMLGAEETEKLLKVHNSVAPIVVQTNRLKAEPQQLRESLEKSGVQVKKHDSLPGCFELSETGNVEKLEAFSTGMMRVQDAAAMVSVLAGSPKQGETVVDGCSAPGGKSFAAADLMKNQGKIYSFDVHEHKINIIEKGAERLGVKIITAGKGDSRVTPEQLRDKTDLVIADVPCSGLGTIRKKPDVRYKSFEDVAALPPLQLEILTALSKCVKPGGRLIYSTCTLNERENAGVVKAFLDANPQFETEDFETPLANSDKGMLTLWPHIHGTDGFFICRMRRNEA